MSKASFPMSSEMGYPMGPYSIPSLAAFTLLGAQHASVAARLSRSGVTGVAMAGSRSVSVEPEGGYIAPIADRSG